MKSFILFPFLVLITVSFSFQSLYAQAPIPNGDFEQWNEGAPVGWLVTNLKNDTTVMQTSDAYSGSSAVQGSVINLEGFAQLPPSAITGSGSVHGFPYTDHPNSFTGYYKFNPVAGDSISILCVLKKNGTGIGGGGFFTLSATSSYTAFSVPIEWLSNDSPDTAIVSISIVTQSIGTANVGSTMEVDDLAFSNQVISSSVSSSTSSFNLGQNYPNPLSKTISTTIAYSLDEPGYTTFTVYDINGRIVATPVQEVQAAGNHLATLDCSRLAAGIYTYRLTCGDRSLAKMFQVLH